MQILHASLLKKGSDDGDDEQSISLSFFWPPTESKRQSAEPFPFLLKIDTKDACGDAERHPSTCRLPLLFAMP